MLLDVLRITLVVALLVVVPGTLLVNALLPPGSGRLTRLERAYMGVAAGTLLLILVGVALGSAPGESGLFGSIATGFPNVELAMLAVSALLLYAGLQRGAYPRLAQRYPRLLRPEGRETGPRRVQTR